MAEMNPRAGSTQAQSRLPSFLIIGVPKAGTTSLAAYLAGHPDIFMSREKELHFFDRDEKDEGWYREQFLDAGAATAVGEATPTYILSRKALSRMASLLPDAKLIVLMRDPVDRAYSHYWWNRPMYERRDFATAVRDETHRNASDRPLDGDDDSLYRTYTGGGRYLELLRRVFVHYPRGSVLPVFLEDLRRDPAGAYGEVCRFVGVEDAGLPPQLGTVINPAYRLRSRRLRMAMLRSHAWRRLPFGLADRIDRMNRVPFTYPRMDEGLRAELSQWFMPANAMLAESLGRALDGTGWIARRHSPGEDIDPIL